MPLASIVLDALFPDSCLACLAPKDASFRHEVACDSCIRSAHLQTMYNCLACGAPSRTIAPQCHKASAVYLTLAPVESRVVGQLSSALLFEGITRASLPLAELLAAGIASGGVPLHKTHITPLPALPSELRERGFDADLLVAEEVASLLRLHLAQHLLTVGKYGERTLYGIGTAGDTASSNLVMLVSVAAVPRVNAQRITSLVRAACPHADVAFLACIG